MAITLIYTRTDKWLISKENIDWTVWQEKLYWFMASLPFDNIVTCAGFLKEEYGLYERQRQYIIDTVGHNNFNTFELYIGTDNDVKVIPIQSDLLQTEGEIIDWMERVYFFTKQGDIYKLWVKLGGSEEQSREIKLNSVQVKRWQEQGNEYIKQLATDLQGKSSQHIWTQ